MDKMFEFDDNGFYSDWHVNEKDLERSDNKSKEETSSFINNQLNKKIMDRNEDLKKNYMGQSCGMKGEKSDNLKNQDITSQSSSKYSSDSSGIAGSGPVSTMNDSKDKNDYKSSQSQQGANNQSSSQSSQLKDNQSSQMKGGCGCGDDDGISYTETVFIIEDEPTDM